MGTPIYTTGIPTAQQSLGQTQQPILNNFSVINTAQSVNHIAYNDNSGNQGKHKFLQMPSQGTNQASSPAAAANEMAFYTRSNGAEDAGAPVLYFKLPGEVAGGVDYKFTRNLAPVSGTTGYTFIPGGFIFQWGQVTTSSTSGTVTFPIGFSANLYNVSLTPTFNSTTPNGAGTYMVNTKPITFKTTSFDWFLFTSSAQFTGFFWTAIGN